LTTILNSNEQFRFSDVSVWISAAPAVLGVPPANVHHKPLVDTGVLPLISHFRRELETVVRVGFLLVFPQVQHPSISTILLHAVFPRLPDWVVNITRPPEQPFFGAKIEIRTNLSSVSFSKSPRVETANCRSVPNLS